MLQFHLYGLFIAIGLIFVYIWVKINSPKYKLDSSTTENALFLGFIFALVGARLYHVLSSWSYYYIRPQEIFFIWHGGLGILGAILGGLAGIAAYCKVNKIRLMPILDLIAPPILLVQAIARIGNFFNYEAFGPPTNLPWGIFIPVSSRPSEFLTFSHFHPTFFYESILCLFAFLFYLLINKQTNKPRYGFAYYLISYGTIRFFTEFLRLDTWKVFDFKIAFLISLLMIVLGLKLFLKPRQTHML